MWICTLFQVLWSCVHHFSISLFIKLRSLSVRSLFKLRSSALIAVHRGSCSSRVCFLASPRTINHSALSARDVILLTNFDRHCVALTLTDGHHIETKALRAPIKMYTMSNQCYHLNTHSSTGFLWRGNIIGAGLPFECQLPRRFNRRQWLTRYFINPD